MEGLESFARRLVAYGTAHPVMCIFLLALAARVLLVVWFPLPDNEGGDFLFYHRASLEWLATGGFGDITFIAPGFPLYLAWAQIVFGFAPGALVLSHIMLGALLAPLVYAFGSLFTTQSVARISGIVAALWPPLVLETFSYGDSTLLSAVLMLVAMYHFLKAMRQDRTTFNALVSGVFSGFSALTDPIFLYIPAVLLVWVTTLFFREHILRRTGARVLFTSWILFLLAFSAVVLPWFYRNLIVLDRAEHVPVVVKDYELTVLSSEHTSRVISAVTLRGGAAKALQLAGHMTLIPYNLSLLDPSSLVSYKELLFSYLRGVTPGPFDAQVISTLVLKSLLALVHVGLVALALYGIFFCVSNGVGLLTLMLAGYVFFAYAMIALPAPDLLRDVSVPNLYFFSLVPLVIPFAVSGAVRFVTVVRPYVTSRRERRFE